MIRGTGTSASLNERLRSYSSRYASDNTDESGGKGPVDRNKRPPDELRLAARTARERDKYDRESADTEKEDKTSLWSHSAPTEKTFVSSHRYVPHSERTSSTGPSQTSDPVGTRVSPPSAITSS